MVPGNIVKVHNRRKNITYSVYGIPENVQANQVIWDELFGFDGLVLCSIVVLEIIFHFSQDICPFKSVFWSRCAGEMFDHRIRP